MTALNLREVPGVAETTLDEETFASLPPSAPGAPWDVTSTGLVWLSRGGRAAQVAAGSAVVAGARTPVVVGGMVAYADTPVGAYREVFGGVALAHGVRSRTTIPFMAVDSRESLVGGRHNWSLPKCLAQFNGSPASGTMTAEGEGWRVHAVARALGPAIPVRSKAEVVQLWPDGVVRTARLTGRARARLAVVTVEVSSSGSLGQWLRPGRHVGAILTDVRFSLPVPRTLLPR